MANVLFTTYCNRNCSYCFARGKVDLDQDQGDPSKNLGRSALEKIIGFFKRSQLSRVVVLGGEPTLNPNFKLLIDRILAEADFKSLMIFTNGLMPESALGYIARNPDPRLQVAFNLNAPETYPATQWEKIILSMKTLGSRIGLGVNVYRPGQDYTYLIDSILAYNLTRHVRVGITQPSLRSQNTAAPQNKLPEIASDLLNFAEKAEQNNISFSFDCGFQFCMFTLEQHKELLRMGIKFKAVCNPIIDIGPDLSVWRCFPFLKDVGGLLTDFDTKNQIIDYYNRKYRYYKPMGNRLECPQCRYRVNGLCDGGCLARTLIAFQH